MYMIETAKYHCPLKQYAMKTPTVIVQCKIVASVQAV